MKMYALTKHLSIKKHYEYVTVITDSDKMVGAF